MINYTLTCSINNWITNLFAVSHNFQNEMDEWIESIKICEMLNENSVFFSLQYRATTLPAFKYYITCACLIFFCIFIVQILVLPKYVQISSNSMFVRFVLKRAILWSFKTFFIFTEILWRHIVTYRSPHSPIKHSVNLSLHKKYSLNRALYFFTNSFFRFIFSGFCVLSFTMH